MSFSKNAVWYVIGIIFFCTGSLWLYMHVGGQRPHCDVDSMAYVERAGYLIAHGNFRNPVGFDLPYYGLGYPLFLAGIKKCFGDSFAWIVLAQLLLALLNFFIIRGIAEQLFGKRAGLIAFLLGCTSVGYLIFVQFVLTEILLATLLAASFYFLLQPQRRSSACYAGLLLGLSVFVKPVALYFTLPLVVGWLFINWRSAIAFLLCFWLLVGGLFLHNYYVFHTPRLGNLAAVNLCYWFYPYLLAYERGTNVEHERVLLSNRFPDAAQVMPAFIATAKARPHLVVYYWGLNMLKTAVGLYTTNLKILISLAGGADVSFFKQTGSLWQKFCGYVIKGASEQWVVVVAVSEIILLGLRYLLVIVGLWRLMLQSHCRWQFLIVMLFLGYFLAVTGHDGCARFRMMIEFLLLVLAAGGLHAFLSGSIFSLLRQDKSPNL